MAPMNGNIALVGCGAIAQSFYLPALARQRSSFQDVWLVDPSDRARAVASSAVAGEQARVLSEVPVELAFVIVAAPNALHFPIAMEAIARGAHVLVEKPFAVWPNEGRRLVQTAAASSRLVAVNQTRRFFPSVRDLRRRITAGEFGALKRVVHKEGVKLAWPFESGAAFARDAQRTGVIMDFGVHVLDFYQCLLQPEWAILSARHDGFAGPEGLAAIELQANGAPISILLSRYNSQDNRARLSFEKADIVMDVYGANAYSVHHRSGGADHINVAPGTDFEALAQEVLRNLAAAARAHERLVCDAASVLPVIDLLDEIYRCSDRFPEQLGMV